MARPIMLESGIKKEVSPIVSGGVNVRWSPHNATGDGSTDDTTAILTAIVEATSGSDDVKVIFPAGTYRLTGTNTFGSTVHIVLEPNATLQIEGTLTMSGTLEVLEGGLLSGSGTLAYASGSKAIHSTISQVYGSSLTVTGLSNSGVIDYVTPEMFGAVDGTADDVEINLALSSANIVQLSSRTYTISSTIDLNGSNTLQGNGDSTVISAPSLDDAIIQADGNNYNVVKALKVLGSGNPSHTSQQGINFQNSDYNIVSSVTVSSAGRNSIRVAGLQDSTTYSEYNRVENCYLTGGYSGIWLFAGALHNTVTGNTIVSPDYYGIVLDDGSTSWGVNAKPSNYNTITGNTVDSCPYNGIHNENSSYNVISSNTVVNCGTTVGYTLGNIVISNAQNGNKSVGCVISGNNIYNAGDHGIEIVGSDRNLVIGNEIHFWSQRVGNAGGHGVRIRSTTYDPGTGSVTYTSEHNTIMGNMIWQVSTAESGGNAGDACIALEDSSVKYTTLKSNIVRNENTAVTDWLDNSSTGPLIIGNILGDTSTESIYAHYDSVYFYRSSASDYIIQSNVAGTDNYSRFRINMKGQLEWGNGVSTPDTLLGREAASVLKTEDALHIERATYTDNAVYTGVTGESLSRFLQRADGYMSWGSGAASRDMALYRPGNYVLSIQKTSNGQETHNGFSQSTVSAGSGSTITASYVIPSSSLVLGVTARVTTSLGTVNGLTTFSIGDGTDIDAWGTGIAVSGGTTTSIADFTITNPAYYPSSSDVILTADAGTFDGTGEVRVTVHYIKLVAATS